MYALQGQIRWLNAALSGSLFSVEQHTTHRTTPVHRSFNVHTGGMAEETKPTEARRP